MLTLVLSVQPALTLTPFPALSPASSTDAADVSPNELRLQPSHALQMLNHLFELIPIEGQTSEFFASSPAALIGQLQICTFVPRQAGGFCRPSEALLSTQTWSFGPDVRDEEADALKLTTAQLVAQTGLQMVHQDIVISVAVADRLGIRRFDASLWCDLLQQAAQAWTRHPEHLDVDWIAWALANIYNEGQAGRSRAKLVAAPLLPLTNGLFATMAHGAAYDVGLETLAPQAIAALPDARILSTAFTDAVGRHPGATPMLGLLGVERVASRRFLREHLAPSLCDPEASPSASAIRLLLATICLSRLQDVTPEQFATWTADHGGCILFDEEGSPVRVTSALKALVFSHAFSSLSTQSEVDELEVWPLQAGAPREHLLLSRDYASVLRSEEKQRDLARSGCELLVALGVRKLFTSVIDADLALEMPVLCDFLSVVQCNMDAVVDSSRLWRGLARHLHVIAGPKDERHAAHFAHTRRLLASTRWVKTNRGAFVVPAEANRAGSSRASDSLGDLVVIADVPGSAVEAADYLGLKESPSTHALAERWRLKCLACRQKDGSMAKTRIALRQSEALLSRLSREPQALQALKSIPFVFVPDHEEALAMVKWQAQKAGTLPLDRSQPVLGTFQSPERCVAVDKSSVFDSAAFSMDKDAIALAQELDLVRVLVR